MTSIEALWIVKFGDVLEPSQARNGGVVVLESGKIFGGDSGYAYVGEYKLNDSKLLGNLTITQFDPQMPNVFGLGVDEFTLKLKAEFQDPQIVGTISITDPPIELPIFMLRFKELP